MISDKAKALEHLKTFLSYLEIAREQDVFNGDSSKGKYDEARLFETVKKMQPFIGAIQSIFDDLKIEYIQTFPHAHDKTPRNIIEMSVKEYPSYPYNEARHILIPKIKGAIFSLEEGYSQGLEKNQVSGAKRFRLENYELHKKIVEVSGQLFEDGHYKDAIFKAYVEVIDRVKQVARTPRASNGNELDGDNLMNHVFKPENPIIKLNELQTDADIDEQRGFMFLFKGICGLRNKKGHKNFVQNDPNRTIEHLALASLLIGLLDDEFINAYN